MENKTIIVILIGIAVFMYLNQLVPACVSIPLEELSTEEPDVIYNQNEERNLLNDLNKFSYIIVTTTGESMFPIIKTNSKCICEKRENYNVGDIVLFIDRDDMGVGHQIVYEGDDYFITKGKNNNFVDSPISKNSVICSIPYVKRINLNRF